MTIKDALFNSVSFSVSTKQAEVIAITRGLNVEDMFTPSVAQSREFLLSKADIIRLAITQPNVSEGGVSISFSDRKAMLSIANSIYAKYGEPLVSEQNPSVSFVEDW